MGLESRLFHDAPVFAAIAIDASGSMSRHVEQVVEGHHAILSTLRNSEKCARGVVYVYQTLFGNDISTLHPWALLDPEGNDNVVALNASNYRPHGLTPLYDAVYQLLQDLKLEALDARSKGLRSSLRILVITGGGENCSTIGDSRKEAGGEQMIRDEVQKLRDQELLESSVVFGVMDSDFTPDMLEDTRQRLGFRQCVQLAQLRDIRRVFRLHAVQRTK